MNKWHGIAVLAPLLALVCLSYASSGEESAYGTWQSLEPDSWASTWLILTYIDPDADITIRPSGSQLNARTLYAVPDSKYVRDGQSSAFEKLLSRVSDPDPSLARMGSIIHAVESATWGAKNSDMARVVENSYRALQSRFDRHYVPVTCYGEFFETLHQSIKAGHDPGRLASELNGVLDSVDTDCNWGAGNGVARQVVSKGKNQVETVPTRAILNAIAAGKEVIFVDTRENREYQESHIPGATNIKLREVDGETADRLSDADLVVSYCLKDFRGYEVARKLMKKGVEHSSVMKPHGYVGWKKLGLPIHAGDESEAQAVARLSRCADSAEECIEEGG